MTQKTVQILFPAPQTPTCAFYFPHLLNFKIHNNLHKYYGIGSGQYLMKMAETPLSMHFTIPRWYYGVWKPKEEPRF